MTFKRTMLATDFDIDKAQFPYSCSTKIDGVQGNVQQGRVLPRSLKSFGNLDFIERFSVPELEGLNFEITLGGNPTAPNLAHDTSGALRNINGKFEFHIWVYDVMVMAETYEERVNRVIHRVRQISKYSPIYPFVHVITPSKIMGAHEYYVFRNAVLDHGYEGVVLRKPESLYKSGRATAREQGFLRDKAKASFEIRITGVKEASANNNEKKVNELGLTARSTHKENKTAKGVVGSVVGEFVKDTILGGVTFKKGQSVTSGAGCLTQEERELFFRNPNLIIGKIAEIECLAYGIKDAPRQPVVKCLRDLIDWDIE